MSIKHWLGCACAVWLISLAAQGCGSRAARPTQALGMAGAAAGAASVAGRGNAAGAAPTAEGAPDAAGASSCAAPGGCWLPLSAAGAPEARQNFAQVWTGTELVIWGGEQGATQGELRSGGAYALASGTWRNIAGPRELLPRIDPCYAYTGSELWLWGGANADGDVPPPQLSLYDPRTNSWTLPSAAGAEPEARAHSTAVWTGTSVFVWGGLSVAPQGLATGARFDVNKRQWLAMAVEGAPSPRYDHLALWTGTRVIVWGGSSAGQAVTSGAAYDPINDRWSAISARNGVTGLAPIGTWTGTEVFVWGDEGPALYDPKKDEWRTPTLSGAPSARRQPMIAWTGRYVIVWGGRANSALLADGAMYDVAADQWTPMSTENAPSARITSAVWAGSAMLVWGGSDWLTHSALNDGAAFTPPN